MSNSAKWYVIHTYSGYENKVATNIEKAVESRGFGDLIEEVKVPTETITEIKKEKEITKERKLFPGYVFVKMVMDDDAWYIVRNIRGVTGFVGPGSKPIPLTDEEITRLGVEKISVIVSYEVGDTVRITGGPLTDFVGIVNTINLETDTVNVTVSMFGKDTPADLTLRQVETI